MSADQQPNLVFLQKNVLQSGNTQHGCPIIDLTGEDDDAFAPELPQVATAFATERNVVISSGNL